MPTLTNQLKASVKAVKNGTLKNALRPVPELPEGAMMDANGDFVLPSNPAECADLLYRTIQARLALQRLATRHEELESDLKNHFIDTLPMSNATGISGQVARVQIKPKPIPVVDGEDGWNKLYAYIRKHAAFELLERRLGRKAAQERLDAGEGKKMGVTVFNAKEVSCTKI